MTKAAGAIWEISVGKVYKHKKGSGCAMCKPHKHGWSPKEKDKYKRQPDEEVRHEDHR